MHPVARDHIVASDDLWARLVIHREIMAALSIVEEAGAALVRFIDEADWQSEGFRALQALLVRMRDDTGAESGSLNVRAWESSAGGRG